MTTAIQEPATRARTTRVGDAVFRRTALMAALLVVGLLAGVAIFLVIQGIPALDASGDTAYGKDSVWAFVGPLLFGTVLSSILAMVIVTPLAIGLALVISHYAPRRVAKPVGDRGPRAADGAGLRLAQLVVRVDPALRRAGVELRPHLVDGVGRAGADGAADRDGHPP